MGTIVSNNSHYLNFPQENKNIMKFLLPAAFLVLGAFTTDNLGAELKPEEPVQRLMNEPEKILEAKQENEVKDSTETGVEDMNDLLQNLFSEDELKGLDGLLDGVKDFKAPEIDEETLKETQKFWDDLLKNIMGEMKDEKMEI